jgi:class 3 adenylate cyclase
MHDGWFRRVYHRLLYSGAHDCSVEETETAPGTWIDRGSRAAALSLTAPELAPMFQRTISTVGMKSERYALAALTIAQSKLLGFARYVWALSSRNVVLVLVATGALIIVPRVSATASAMIGIEAWIGEVAISLLLTTVCVATHQRRRSDEARGSRLSREMRDMRRHVPDDAVAMERESGRALVCGEREISVLFVDMRGFTGFSEDQTPAQIFAMVSRFTECVSTIIQRHHGSVVAFGGDGIMAVFGAPNPLPQKERAAVEAGHAIVATIQSAAAGTVVTDTLSVGIGIATGTDFVGNLQVVNGEMWTVIGNTANLAARLQALTRRFDAAMVIDERTHAASAGATAAFETYPNIAIRGRRDRQDVYVLPLRPEGRQLLRRR